MLECDEHQDCKIEIKEFPEGNLRRMEIHRIGKGAVGGAYGAIVREAHRRAVANADLPCESDDPLSAPE